MDPLTANLLDLLFELEGRGIPIMIGGGYGLFLKGRHLATTGERTLLEMLPKARATNDLDLFLRAELLSEPRPHARGQGGDHPARLHTG